MRLDRSRFIAWQQADQRAKAAEARLFAKLVPIESRDLPTPAEMEEARVLRDTATRLMQEMLVEMQVRAASLSHRKTGTLADRPSGDPRDSGFTP